MDFGSPKEWFDMVDQRLNGRWWRPLSGIIILVVIFSGCLMGGLFTLRNIRDQWSDLTGQKIAQNRSAPKRRSKA